MMQVKTCIVNCFLPAAKFATNRYRSGKICIVTSVLSAKIHQDQFSFFTFLVVLNIMQCPGTVAAGNDRAITRPG